MAVPNLTDPDQTSPEETLAPDGLLALRQAIDTVDDRLHDLLIERAALVWRVGELKGRSGGGPFYRPEREAQIHRRLEGRHHGYLPVGALHRIYREIISASLSLEKRLTVTYLGPEATFAHQAALKHFGSSCEMVAAPAAADVFREVETGRSEFGVVPVESSAEGMVYHLLDRLAEGSLFICAEIVLPEIHHLLATETDRQRITTLYGHPQSLRQCHHWLARHLPGVDLREVASTALAARQARAGEGAAVVAGAYAADEYGLNVLAEHIEDEAGVVNRFLVIGTQDALPSGRDQTSVVLSFPDRPGSLHRVLGIFADQAINLTRIESRPSRRKAWDYLFFMDFEGHRQDGPVMAALNEAGELPGVSVRVLGSYPRPVL